MPNQPETAQSIAPANFLQDRGGRGGIRAWLLTTDHKRIGLLYLMVQTVFFLVAVALGVLMRIHLLSPEGALMSASEYNAAFTLHGVIMIFIFVIPVIPSALGNFFLPIMIGAKDVAFPRLNLLTWYLYMAGTLIVLISLFSGGGLPDTGWTFYVPYSMYTHTNVQLAVFGVFVLGFSSILTGVNFVTTVHRLRAPGMGWMNMPLFPWALYATAWVQILATPVLGITMLLVWAERIFHVGIFDPAMGGDPLLYQHLFWMYSHPAVYIIILPAMGVISELIPTFARRAIFGYKSIVVATIAIAFLGSLVWAHHMFTTGMSDLAAGLFSLLTFLVAVPSAIKVFNWTATLYKGSVSMEPPMLFALSFVFLFSVGGLTGLLIGALAINVVLHNTYFIVGHFHYIILGGTGFALFGALHYWLPKMFGKMYNRPVAYISWALFFVGFNIFYFSFLIMGVMGMPRRWAFYLPRFQVPQVIASVGAWVMALGILFMVGNLIVAVFGKRKAGDNPWGGITLEWQIPSPPPVENFPVPPRVTPLPYDFEGAFGHE